MRFSGSSCTQRLPPRRTSPLSRFLQGINHRICLFVAYPPHGAPHTFRNLFKQKRQIHLHPYLPGQKYTFLYGTRPTSHLFVFSVGIISFPRLFSVPVSAASMIRFHYHRRRRHTRSPPAADILPSNGHLCSCMSWMSFQKALFASLFHSVARFPLTIHCTSQHPEFQTFKVPGIIISFSSEAYVLVHCRLAGLGSRSILSASSMRSFSICSWCSFE